MESLSDINLLDMEPTLLQTEPLTKLGLDPKNVGQILSPLQRDRAAIYLFAYFKCWFPGKGGKKSCRIHWLPMERQKA